MSTTLQCIKTTALAVLPSKAGPNEVGYDMTLVRIHSRIDEDTIMYDTDIITKPPLGYYSEIVPRSSIVKTGWILANSVGVIDPTYRGTIKVVLKRTRPGTKELELPCKIVQLILRKLAPNYEVSDRGSFKFEETERKGGFGSTDEAVVSDEDSHKA